MNIKILFSSKSGNSQKIADAIAQSLSLTTEPVPPAYPFSNVSLLFLGADANGGKIDEKTKYFIKTLDIKKVKNVALFSTSGDGKSEGINVMKELVAAQGINVLEKSFACEGKYSLFKANHPNADDLKNAQDFAKACIDSLQ
jgi:flavodoxin